MWLTKKEYRITFIPCNFILVRVNYVRLYLKPYYCSNIKQILAFIIIIFCVEFIVFY